MLEIFKKYASVYKMTLGSYAVGVGTPEGNTVAPEVIEGPADKLSQETLHALNQAKEFDNRMSKDIQDFVNYYGVSIKNENGQNIAVKDMSKEHFDEVLEGLRANGRTEEADHLSALITYQERVRAEISPVFYKLQQTSQQRQNADQAINELNNARVDTGLNNLQFETRFLGLIKVGSTDRVRLTNKMSESSKVELDKMLSDPNFCALLYNNFDKLFDNNGSPSRNFISELNSIGYVFENSDKNAVFANIVDFTQLSENLQKQGNLSDRDVLKVISDYNLDGDLSRDDQSVVGELQTYLTAGDEYFNPNGLENILKLIGDPRSVEEFKFDFKIRPYANIKAIQNGMLNAMSAGMALSEVLSVDGLEKTAQRDFEGLESVRAEVESIMDKRFASDEKFSTISEADKSRLKFLGVGILTGANRGIAANWSIEELTNGLLDNVAVGFINGVPGIGVFKTFYEENGIKLTGGLVNAVPVVSASKRIERDGKAITAYATVSLVGGAVGANVDFLNNQTEAGIESLVQEFEGKKDEIKNAIDGNKPYNESFYPIDEASYNLFKEVVRVGQEIGNPNLFDTYYTGAQDAYRNGLYQKAQGIKTSGFGFGVAAAGPFIFPYVSVSLQRIKQKYTEQFPNINRQEAVTAKKMDYEIVPHEGKNVVLLKGFHDNYKVTYYSPDGQPVQAEMSDRGLMIGGNINAVKQTLISYTGADHTGDLLEVAILVNGATMSEDNRVDSSAITSGLPDIESNTVDVKTERIEKDLEIPGQQEVEEIMPQILGIVENISVLNLRGRVNESNRLLQKSLQSLLSNSLFEDLGEITNSPEAGFANSTWNDVKSLYERVVKEPALPDNLTDHQKVTLMQRVYGRFMADLNIIARNSDTYEDYLAKIKLGDDPSLRRTYELMHRTDLVQFETQAYSGNQNGVSRAKIFSTQYSNAWKIDTSNLDVYRNNLLQNNFKGQKKVTSQTQDGLMAFVASAQVDINGNRTHEGITPMVGALEVAVGSDGPAIEVINDDSIRNAMILNLPPSYKLGLINAISQATQKNINETQLMSLLSGEKVDGVTLDYETIMFKWGDCFNDALGLRNFKISLENEQTNQIVSTGIDVTSSQITASNIVDNNVLNGFVAVTGSVGGDGETTHEETDADSRPDEVDTPTVEQDGSSIPSEGSSGDLSNNANGTGDVAAGTRVNNSADKVATNGGQTLRKQSTGNADI